MRVWIIAKNNQLKTVVSNKKKLWEQILKRLQADEKLLGQKLQNLVATTYPNWKDNENMDLSNPKQYSFTKQHVLYSLFKEDKHLKIHIDLKEENALTIWEREVE